MNASSKLKRALSLKTKAKNRRDSNRYEAARACLLEAVVLLDEEFNEATRKESRSGIARELAESWGLLGGVERRWALEAGIDGNQADYEEHMLESAKAYDEGYNSYESNVEFGILDSYNLVNRLVSRILLVPACLSETMMKVEGLNVMQQLAIAREQVRRQALLARRGDVWVLSDLALLDILVERRQPIAAYSDFVSQSPPDYAYDSALSVLESLQNLELPMKDEIDQAVSHLQTNLKRVSQ